MKNPSRGIIQISGDAEGKVIIIGGKEYHIKKIKARGHEQTTILVEMSQSEWREQLERVAVLLVKKSKLSAPQIVAEALSYLDLDTIAKIEKKVVKENKPVSVDKGCLEINIGGTKVPLVSG